MHSNNIKVLPQQFEKMQYWLYGWEGFMKYTIMMASGGTINIPQLMMISSDTQVILSLLLQQFEML
jgi:hypothetical protein